MIRRFALGLLYLSFCGPLLADTPDEFSTNTVRMITHPNQYFQHHPFDSYEIVVAIDMKDQSSIKFVDTKLAEIKGILNKMGIPYRITRVSQERLDAFHAAHNEVIDELKVTQNIPKGASSNTHRDQVPILSSMRQYWRNIYVPATSDAIERGLMFGVGMQGFIAAATGYFLEGKTGLTLSGQVGVVALFGGLLGVWNDTYRNFLRIPDNAAATFAKAMAISAAFAVPIKMLTESGRIALGTIVGMARILEHCVLSQVAKLYITKILLFREKYGYMSHKQAFYWSQVGVFGVYLFLRLCHLNDVPFLAHGFFAMGPIGFLAHLGYRGYLVGTTRQAYKFHTLGDVESGRIILTAEMKNFEDEFLGNNPELRTLNDRIEDRSLWDREFRSYFLRVTTKLFVEEITEIRDSIVNSIQAGGKLFKGTLEQCGILFLQYPLPPLI